MGKLRLIVKIDLCRSILSKTGTLILTEPVKTDAVAKDTKESKASDAKEDDEEEERKEVAVVVKGTTFVPRWKTQ